MRVLELADKLRARGLTVVEVAGWKTRGIEFPNRPDGAIRHWTAGPATGNTPSLNICTNGRSDLPGPLCNTFQSRAVDANGYDIVYLVASGKANHAGTGGWNGMTSNYSVLGLEIEWSGPNEAFANVRKRKLTSELIMRAMMDCAAGTNDNDCCEHREWAPTRKIDTNLSGDELRRRMTELRVGTTPQPPAGEEDDMKSEIITYEGANQLWITGDYVTKRRISTEHAGAFVWLGRATWDPNKNSAWVWPQDIIDRITSIDDAIWNLAVGIGEVPAKTVAAMPPAVPGTGGGNTKEELVAATREGVVAELGFLQPNK